VIPITKPCIGEEEAIAAKEAILSGWVTQGPRVKAFEDAFADYVGADFACAVSSCTTALHLALIAVGVKPGDIVITVSHSFIATANAVRYCSAEPVFVDIDLNTLNMDPDDLRRCLLQDCEEHGGRLYYRNVDRLAAGESPLRTLINNSAPVSNRLGRIACILPVHQMGLPCDIAEIVSIAKDFALPVIEDAACAVGSEVSFDGGKTWDKIGRPHGDIACFSFHPRKILTTGDGGMITTNDPKFDNTFRLLRQHGMTISDTVRHRSNKVVFEEYVTTAFNYRLTDIQAAMGIEQLKKIDSILNERRRLAGCYEEFLGNIPHIELPRPKHTVLPNWQSYPVRLLEAAPCNQYEFMQTLLKKGISSRRGIMNGHQELPYIDAGWSLPKSENSRDWIILLPLYPGIGVEKLKYISDVIRGALNK
jgi:perosamine synthetase